MDLGLNCVALYYKDCIPPKKTTEYYDTLLDEIEWEEKPYKKARDTALYGDPNVQYNYGRNLGELVNPTEWTRTLLEIKNIVELKTGGKYNICLCAYYKDGTKAIG